MALPNVTEFPKPRDSGSTGPPEIYLYQSIGSGLFGGISAEDVVKTVSAHAQAGAPDLSIRINSPGGEVFEGLSIYNALTRYPGRVTTYIDGAAWSIASVIAMGGTSVHMAQNAQIMIHDPAALYFGVAEDFRQLANQLDQTKESLITAYQRQTRAGRTRLSDWMSAETWFTAAEAEREGLVTVIDEPLPIAACAPAFMKFKNMPAWVHSQVAKGRIRPLLEARAVGLKQMQERSKEILKRVS